MFRLIVGVAIGWLTAYWYFSGDWAPAEEPSAQGRRGLQGRAQRVARATGEVARELGQEMKSAATIGRNNLQDKARRIGDAAKKE
ncbi:MAG: hypothetical protein M1401_08870 [Chloroflexi bacterium]|nr:hypothetical protein [Chloroflexota bacterium]